MATRAIIRIAEREEGVSFSKHADNIRINKTNKTRNFNIAKSDR